MNDAYKFWQDSLAGLRPQITNEQPEYGFYRMKRGGRWVPVAVWPLNGALNFKFGKEIVGANVGTEQWPYYAANPISEKIWRAVVERGEAWPDADPVVESILNNARAVKLVDTADSKSVTSVGSNPTTGTIDFTDEMREQIATALMGVPGYAKIEGDTESAKGAGLRNMLLKLANEADKMRTAEKAPHLSAATAVDAKWQPIVKAAKAGADKIRASLESWENDKRAAARQAEIRAAVEQAHRDEEAAHRDISEPEPQPVVPQSNLPPPAAQVRPTFGKAAAVHVYQHVVSIDATKVFEQFKDRADVVEFLTALAQKTVNAGIAVPGATTESRTRIK